jgi:PmbA protein
MPQPIDPLELLAELLKRAKAKGADAADALYAEADALEHGQRLGQTEKLERAEGRDLGLRVFIGKRQASVSSTELTPRAIDDLAERAVAMARAVPEDPYCGLADPGEILRSPPAIDMFDPAEPDAATLIERARAAEEAARAVSGVTNSEGASASWSTTRIWLAASNGFGGAYRRSFHTVAVSVIAGEGTAMETDYDYHSAVYARDLDDPAQIGRTAGERAVARLNPRKMPTAKVPVVFDHRVSGGIVGHLLSAINGTAIARGTSFLKDKMGSQVFAPGTRIVDDPLRPRGLRSKSFDAEGLPTQTRALIDDGRLATWLLDLRSARQLGLKSTGHAARGAGGPPTPSATNVHLANGAVSPAALIGAIESGFYVTGLIGMGVNMVTGDYSRGASGFWIEKGKLAFPVSEMTIAGNLADMFRALTPANDLEFRHGTDAPTLRIDGMTVAGG